MDSKTGTVSDNELIAQFMGFEVYNDELFGKTIRVFSIKTNDSVLRALKRQHTSQLQYGISWDWLMPVVEKINQTKPKHDFFAHLDLKNLTIDSLYKAVVEFIRWYNSQSPTTIK